MQKKLHPTQQRILKLSERVDLNQLSLRSIGSLVNVQHPQVVDYHLKQLKKRGLIQRKGTQNLLSTLKRIKEQSIVLQKDIDSVIDYLTITSD